MMLGSHCRRYKGLRTRIQLEHDSKASKHTRDGGVRMKKSNWSDSCR